MMRTVAVEDAVGHVICHDITCIVKDQSKGPRFRKGHIVKQEDIPVLLSMGKERLYIWEKPEGFLHEDEAAEELDRICRGSGIIRRGPSEGKIEHYAEIDGLFQVERAVLTELNSIDGLAVSTLRDGTPVCAGDLLAGMKAIPLVIEAAQLNEASAAAPRPFLRVLPWRLKSAAIITTGSEVATGRISDTFTPVVRTKLEQFGITVIFHELSGDDSAAIAAAVERARKTGAELIICTGGMSVDPDDCTPGALRRIIGQEGGTLVCYGAPVMPGAMFLLAYLDGNIPVIGLPGCVMFARATIFDLLLPQFAAGIILNKKDIIELGHGGICLSGKGCAGECHFPNCRFGSC
ncbi:MAG: molybdopterin-binding protein [Spirochaetaceae bacterium]|jgi:hypothetical protein|nr:molybdopterin-binding protein [Spirochaetaceae bacterium]